MDRFLAELVVRDTPKINPIIANGLATTHMQERVLIDYVDKVWQSVSRSFPPGLVYHGIKRCSPQEEYNEGVKKKKQFDTARSDLYLTKSAFSFNGKELPPRYMYMPFVGDAGSIVISGANYVISPTLSDRMISIGEDSIFLRLLRDKLTFKTINHHYMVDDKRETSKVHWSLIYHKNKRQKKLKSSVSANCSLMHYLLCKYGFKDTFLKFAKCEPIVGGSEINRETYPEADWIICTSTGVPPLRSKRMKYYKPSSVRVAIKRSEMSTIARNMLGGFFYVVDHFPERMSAEYVESKRWWKILMGLVLFTDAWSEGKLHDDIEDHMNSLDEYLDTLMLDKLREIGIPVSDIYEVFAVIIDKGNDWVLTSADKLATMYDKEMSILYYVLYEITSAIVKLCFRLKAAAKKQLTEKDINTAFNMTIKSRLIYYMTKTYRGISTVTTPGDNKAFKATAILVPQSDSSRNKSKKDRAVLDDPSKRLHESIAEVGGYANLPKTEPSGRSRVNPMVRISETGLVLRNPALVDTLEKTAKFIRRR